jgi:hypothetical protein
MTAASVKQTSAEPPTSSGSDHPLGIVGAGLLLGEAATEDAGVAATDAAGEAVGLNVAIGGVDDRPGDGDGALDGLVVQPSRANITARAPMDPAPLVERRAGGCILTPVLLSAVHGAE